MDRIEQAIVEARLAYEFNANSYSFGALLALFNLRADLERPDWIAEYFDYSPMEEKQ